MDPRKTAERSLALVVTALLCACATVDTKKVTSVVDPERIDAVQELAVWKQQADTSAKLAPAQCESKYASAQQQVKGWIEGPLAIQIDDTAAQSYGTVDLRKQQIPPQLSNAVGEFNACTGGVAERGVEEVGRSLFDWAVAQAHGERKKSADALKAQLKAYEWVNWDDAKKSPPR